MTNRCFAGTAGNANHRDAAIVALREQVLDNGATNRARFAVGRLQVHQQARAGIDLDDGTALFVERAGYVLSLIHI